MLKFDNDSKPLSSMSNNSMTVDSRQDPSDLSDASTSEPMISFQAIRDFAGHAASLSLHRTHGNKCHLRRNGNGSLIRSRPQIDIETGHPGLDYECTIQEVTIHQLPHDRKKRFRKQLTATLCKRNARNELESEGNEQEPPKQYRLSTRKTRPFWSTWNVSGADDDVEDLYKNHYSFASIMSRYLNWTYRTNFTFLLLHFAATFWTASMVWAAIILAASEFHPQCLQVGGLDPTEISHHFFMDAYTLSWTTFSSVGYGLIYPQIGSNAAAVDTRCADMNVLMALEAFFGNIFTAMCGAIIFGKIIHVHCFANLTFSCPIIINYGPGVANFDGDTENIEQGDAGHFPMLEFRVLNGNHGRNGGEILDARVKCISAVGEHQASDAVLLASGVRKASKRLVNKVLNTPMFIVKAGMEGISFVKENISKSRHPTGSPKVHSTKRRMIATIPEHSANEAIPFDDVSHQDDDHEFNQKDEFNITKECLFLAARSRKHQVMDEGSHLVPRRIMSHLELETDSHPSLKRVWILRHELNDKSPLLKGKARKMIADNGGKWPKELNTHQRVRESLCFHELSVLITGTSNATGAKVYKQHVYKFDNVIVGYSFVNMFQLNDQGMMSVDEKRLNDVVEQRGGGGEPLEGNKQNGNIVTQHARAIANSTRHIAEGLSEQVQDVADNALNVVGDAALLIKDDAKAIAKKTKEGIGILVTLPRRFSLIDEDTHGATGEISQEPKKTE